ncbi:MAG TPA: OmpA family protein [Streptosporangiaceae bacterium]|nr:OmpA family protein [Streptosporangiaceae bacterium]
MAIGARSNVPEATIPDYVTTLIEAAANAGKQISLIRIDGQPKIFSPPPFTTNAQNSAARQQDLVNYINNNVQPILQGEIRAKVAQADVLTALDLAASATGPDGNIVVIDSGLQTVAPLDYQQPGLLMSPASDLVAFLQQQRLMPDLTGRHVVLAGFGYTAAPQPTLNGPQQSNVLSQWEAIVKAAGGCVTADTLPNTAAEIAGLPPVGIVRPPTTPTFSNCGTIKLEDAGSVGFTVGTATFRDPSGAQETLSRLANTLMQGGEHITLIGSTSSEGGNKLNDRLSLARARAVESVLVSKGIPTSRITAVGDGSHWPGRVNDRGRRGVLLPGPAETNREVIVQLPQCT